MNTQKGFTIVELLIAIALFSVFSAIGVGGFINALHTQRQVSSLLAVQGNASEAIEELTRDVRTGRLFCHDAGGVTPTSSCGCTVSSSDYSNVAAPGALPGGALPVWTCSELNYTNASDQMIGYSVQNGALEKSVDGNV